VLEKLDETFVHREDALKQVGVNPFVYYWGDLLGNPVGGRAHGYDWAQLLVFGAKVDLDPIGWKGGTIVFSFSDGTGYNVGQTIGNIFTPAQAKSFPTFANNVLYLKQMLLDGNLELRLGRFPSASVFASLPAMGSLPVSGAANGTPTSLFSNLKGWHSTGRPSWAAYAKYLPTKDTYIKAAVLQVNPQAVDVNYHGLYMGINRTDGTLLLTEWGWTPTFRGSSTPTDAPGNGKSVVAQSPAQGTNSVTEYPGIYCFGSYLQNYPQTQFNGQGVYEQYGFYWESQQMIWRNPANPNQNLSLWGGVTYSPQTQAAQMPIMGFGGIYYKGLIPMRARDISMLNFYTGALSGDYAQTKPYQGATPTQESVVELSYIVQLSDHFQIQPDLQWIIQPGGYSNVPNALVVGFQVAALF
jgi:porin